jgi:F-type H+-transporting ATPase subunit delta
MAERITTARPYAKAIFSLARDRNTLEATAAGLTRAAEVVTDARVKALIGSPHLTPVQLADIVTGVVGTGLDESSRNFVALLAANRRLGFLPEIAALFELMKSELENAVDVEVVAASEPTSDQLARFTESLQKKLGRKVRLHTKVDGSLMGGAVLKAGDLVIDGSIKGRLERLAVEMTA